MNVLPVVNNTLALYPFQGNMHDSSGFGLNLATLDAFITPPVAGDGGTEQYATLDSCLQAFKFNGSTKLWAPLFTPLQITGDMTVEWLAKIIGTFTQTFFTCADPTAARGGPNGIGSLYTVWRDSGGAEYTNEHIGSNIPTSSYGNFLGSQTAFTPDGNVHFYTFRRSGTTLSIFVDGVKYTPDITDIGPNVAAGTERFFIGGHEGPGNNLTTNVLLASFRVVNYARTDAQIAADSAFCLSTTCGLTPTPPVTDGSTLGPDDGAQGSSSTGNIVYDGLAAAQFGLALQQAPKS